ncbi:hypothetical protein EZV62_006921 [Acer yangbiense]|uniref:Transposase Tnp1/En/Spm-like domain-containing protein n=1 Tax=Acer yangbiense TaxID=1000413 RepID=A0A5C7IB68_9ROSI|nr:hypothetical protein EZV62_006921 [Acer yangbiense]
MNHHAMLVDQNSKTTQTHQVQRQKTPLHCSYCDRDHHSIEKCYYLHGFPVGHKLHGKNVKPPNQRYSNANNVRVETNKAPETGVKSFSADEGPRLTIEEYNQLMAMIKKNDSNSQHFVNATDWYAVVFTKPRDLYDMDEVANVGDLLMEDNTANLQQFMDNKDDVRDNVPEIMLNSHEMHTLNMMKRKRVQVGDTQPLSGRGVVHVSNIKSSIQKVVGLRANCPQNITNMQFAEKGATNTLESRKNIELGIINNLESANKNLEIMSDDSEIEEPSDLNIDETQDDAGSTSKKTRGRTRLQLLHLQKELIQVELNVLRQPIGEPGHKLGQYIGFIVSDSAIAHLTFEDWRYMPKEIKIHMYDIIKNRSETNKTNYGKMTMHHTGGTKSFARLQDELDPEGKEPDKITMFKATYTKKKDKPTDPTVANAMRRMDELIINQPDASKNEVFNQVIGEVSPEAHVSTLTYGLGINQSKQNGKRSSHLDTLKMLDDERIQSQTANEKITHLRSELTELKSQLQTMEEMKSQFGEEYKCIWPDQQEFVRMAARFGATIVPFGAVGEDDIADTSESSSPVDFSWSEKWLGLQTVATLSDSKSLPVFENQKEAAQPMAVYHEDKFLDKIPTHQVKHMGGNFNEIVGDLSDFTGFSNLKGEKVGKKADKAVIGRNSLSLDEDKAATCYKDNSVPSHAFDQHPETELGVGWGGLKPTLNRTVKPPMPANMKYVPENIASVEVHDHESVYAGVLLFVEDVEAFVGGDAIVDLAVAGYEAVGKQEPLLEKDGTSAWKARTVPVGRRFARLAAVDSFFWPACGGLK